MTPDRDHYVIHTLDKSGEGFSVVHSESSVCSDIEQGQVENVVAVYRFNPAEGWAHDVSEDFASAIMSNQLNDNGCIADHVRNFLELHLGCEAVACSEREAA